MLRPETATATWVGRCTERGEPLLSFPDHDFESFFTSHYDQLVRSLTAITGDQEVARDCVQDAFVKAAGRWNKVAKLDSPAGWVRRVAINRSHDLHRSDSRRRRREVEVGADSLTGIEDASRHVDGSMRLIALLDELPAQQRAAAALFYIEDLRVADIADALGLSSGAVKFHLSKAREALRHAIEREGQRDGLGA